MLWLWIGARVLANPLANVFQKLLTQQSVPALVVVLATHVILSLACLPVFLLAPVPQHTDFWLAMLASAALAVAGNALLVQAVKLTDLSVLGPINSYKAIVSILPGMLLLHEFPTRSACGGILLIVSGSVLLVGGGQRGSLESVWKNRGVQLRLAALVFSASEAVFLKRAVLSATPAQTFATWSLLGAIISLPIVFVAYRSTRLVHSTNNGAHLSNMLGLAVSFGLMQYSTLVIFARLPVASSLALFQFSTLISVGLGWHFFRERDILSRSLAALVMAVGAALIVYND